MESRPRGVPDDVRGCVWTELTALLPKHLGTCILACLALVATCVAAAPANAAITPTRSAPDAVAALGDQLGGALSAPAFPFIPPPADPPECSNGSNDDGQVGVDFPDDPDCTSATDNRE